jgi:hypothetical protein
VTAPTSRIAFLPNGLGAVAVTIYIIGAGRFGPVPDARRAFATAASTACAAARIGSGAAPCWPGARATPSTVSRHIGCPVTGSPTQPGASGAGRRR